MRVKIAGARRSDEIAFELINEIEAQLIKDANGPFKSDIDEDRAMIAALVSVVAKRFADIESEIQALKKGKE